MAKAPPLKKHKLSVFLIRLVVFVLAILFIAKFGGHNILRWYIQAGVGNCQKIPILCMVPEEQIITFQVNKDYREALVPYKFPELTVSLPRGFTVVKQRIKKVYYKKRKDRTQDSIIYLLYEPPEFFAHLFPQLKREGITDNQKFVKRLMYARQNEIKTITDAFFVIMKGIFTPNLGEQKEVKMAQVEVGGKSAFINYNLARLDNYFDCNVFNQQGDYFKVYIKDFGKRLDLEKVATIISTLEKNLENPDKL